MVDCVSVSEQYEHLHPILYKPFFIGLGFGLALCQCQYTVIPTISFIWSLCK